MAYVPLDENFFTNPKIMRLTGGEVLLYLFGLCYCQQNLTDGCIPKKVVRSASGLREGCARSARGLRENGLWSDCGDHYQVHDWSDWNLSADEQKARISRTKEKARERARRYRERKASRESNAVTVTFANSPAQHSTVNPEEDDPPKGSPPLSGLGADDPRASSAPRGSSRSSTPNGDQPDEPPPEPVSVERLGELAPASDVVASLLERKRLEALAERQRELREEREETP